MTRPVAYTSVTGEDYVTTWPTPTDDQPSLEELEQYSSDGECPATDGCMVEPDGVCEHGHPSWMLALGFI